MDRWLPLPALLLLATCAAGAATNEDGTFEHHDWVIACDNTRTCRAAGYSEDGAPERVSVLLTRAAGPRAPVRAQLQLGDDGETAPPSAKSTTTTLTMRIAGRPLGPVVLRGTEQLGQLSAPQVAALLAALRGDGAIEWVAEGRHWRLSSAGAAAVLLKMDDLQGRVGTAGALMRKGPASEDRVLPPLPVPEVIAAPLAAARPGDAALAQQPALRAALRATLTDADECERFDEQGNEFKVLRLTPTRVLVSATCWMAAYNSGDGHWVVEDRPPFHPVKVTTSATDGEGGEIHAWQKGRGIGDCGITRTWTWDGQRFVPTAAASTGLCRGIAAGGAWELPTVVTKVREAPR